MWVRRMRSLRRWDVLAAMTLLYGQESPANPRARSGPGYRWHRAENLVGMWCTMLWAISPGAIGPLSSSQTLLRKNALKASIPKWSDLTVKGALDHTQEYSNFLPAVFGASHLLD